MKSAAAVFLLIFLASDAPTLGASVFQFTIAALITCVAFIHHVKESKQ